MNKSDKYYLNQGKLELSMLDDEDDEIDQLNTPKTNNKNVLEQFEFEHTKRLRDKKKTGQAKIKVSKEIYSTLHTMGQYLTNVEDDQKSSTNSNLGVKKNINSAKTQMLEQVASTIKVQEVSLPPVVKRQEQPKNMEITKADDLTATGKDTAIFIDRKQEQTISQQDEAQALGVRENQDSKENNILTNIEPIISQEEMAALLQDDPFDEMVTYNSISDDVINDATNDITDDTKVYDSPLNSSVEEPIEDWLQDEMQQEEWCAENIEDALNHKTQQTKIDNLLNNFFDNRKPQYSFQKELKQHIEKKIRAIREYE